MNEPKRHHWWPQLQSGYWIDESGTITAVRSDGSIFRASPEKLGVEKELYTRFEASGQKDLAIEHWFANSVEVPFVGALAHIIALQGISVAWRVPKDLTKKSELKQLGFKVTEKAEYLPINPDHRSAVSAYIAALLVRSPNYIDKLIEFHKDVKPYSFETNLENKLVKTFALDNMLYLFDIYYDAILHSHLMLLLAEGSSTFLFSDAGISVQEPWSASGIPFEIHAPLTPNVAINVTSAHLAKVPGLSVMRLNNKGVGRMNRIALSDCQRFVFCSGKPPLDFIKKHFGKTPPSPFGHRIVNGRLETKYDISRDR